MPTQPTAPSSHRERLHVPVAWWLISLGFAATLVIAIAAYTNLWFGAAVAVLCMLGVCGALWAYGHTEVRADANGVTAGRNHVDWEWVAGVEPLDRDGLRTAMGPGALATAFLVLRPYVRQAVRVRLADPADPHPYWLLSTRHPRRFTQVAEAFLGEGR